MLAQTDWAGRGGNPRNNFKLKQIDWIAVQYASHTMCGVCLCGCSDFAGDKDFVRSVVFLMNFYVIFNKNTVQIASRGWMIIHYEWNLFKKIL